MTLQPPSHSEVSSPVTAVGNAGGTAARQLTEPMRELCAMALLAGNAVFLFLGLSRLVFVIDGWADQFGQRCEAVFMTFVGPIALALPMAALLLSTHLRPTVGRARPIMLAVLVEYGVSALFGLITFLGAFAHDLSSLRATFEGILERGVWIGFLVLACVLAVRVQLGLFPRPKPRPYAAGYMPTTYGQPYPGQPLYPQTYPPQRTGSPASVSPASISPASMSPASMSPASMSPASMSPAAVSGPHTGGLPAVDPNATVVTSGSGWPAVPPPPMPAPPVPTPPVTAPPMPNSTLPPSMLPQQMPPQPMPGAPGAPNPAPVQPAQARPGNPPMDPDPTTRITQAVPVPADLGNDATQVVPRPDYRQNGAPE